MLDIIVIGDVDADIYYFVDHLPTWDEGVLVKGTKITSGGKGANTACVLSTLGAKTGIVTVVGDDDFGRRGVVSLKNNNVDISGLEISDEDNTYHCVVMLDDTGEKAMLVRTTKLLYPSSSQLIEKSSYIRSAKYAHFIGLNPDLMINPVIDAKNHGVKVSIDIDAAYKGLDAYSEILRYVNILLINKQGAERFFPEMEISQMVDELLKYGPEIVVITAGSVGSYAGTLAGERKIFPAYEAQVVDTTGAGDTFSGSFVYAIMNGYTLNEALEFASSAAAISISAIGAQGHLPKQSEINEFIRSRRNNGN